MTELLDLLQDALGDSYLIERELGGGGMSRVFLATEKALKRQVVIKVLAPELTSEVMTARFKREFEVTALLQHPHIVPVLAAAAGDGLLFYVTPYITGETLRRRMEREGALPIGDAARILSEVAGALAYAHERGVVHRDLKPENILLSDGLAVLADFGIASVFSGAGDAGAAGGARLTDLGTSIGTFGYMSPEQAAGESSLDGRSDVYSLAVVGYEMVAGRPPFTGASPLALMTAHLTQPPPPIQSLRADTPPPLAAALHRALEKDPARRFATAGEFRDALGISFTGATGSVAVATRGRRRVAVAVAALSAAAAAAFVAVRANRTPGLDENLVAVAPFEVLDPRLAMWKEGMVDILSTNLDGAGPLRTVSPTTIMRRWSGRAEKASARALGQKTGARLAVFGRIVGAGNDSMRVTATVLDVGTDRVLGDLELRDAESRIDRVADSLTVRILRQLGQTRAIGSVRQASLGSSSLPALKSYLQGEQWYRRSAWDSAASYYRKAIDADSSFAPALRRLSNALAWKTGDGTSTEEKYRYALMAGARNHGLAARESLLVVADSLSAALQTRGTPGFDPYAVARRLVATLEEGARRYPTDAEIWHKLGDMRFHNIFFIPNGTYAESRTAFDRSIELDSAFAPSYSHLPFLALYAQDTSAARRYIRNYLALGESGGYAASFRVLDGLIASHTAAMRAAALDSLRHVSLSDVGTTAQTIVNWMDAGEIGVAVGGVADSMARDDLRSPPGLRAAIAVALPMMLAMRGHLHAATAASDTTIWRILPDLAMLGAVPASRMEAVARAWLAGPPTESYKLPLLFRWWAQRGDTGHLVRAVDTLQRVIRTMPAAQSLLGVARGYLSLARRDSAAAIANFAALTDSVCNTTWCYEDRLTKAQLLSARKMDREAARLLAQDYAFASPGRVLWMLERGRVDERLGLKAQAVDAYGYVVDAWQGADRELQPAVAEAREGLKRLGIDRAKAKQD